MRRGRQERQFRRDVTQAWVYIGERSLPAAERWRADLAATIIAVRETPGLGHFRPDVPPDLTAIRVGSYIALYRVTAERIDFVRLLRGARDFTQIFPT